MNSFQRVNQLLSWSHLDDPLLIHPPDPIPTLNKDIRAYVARADALANETGWVSRPELPTTDEILGAEESEDCGVVSLVPNQILGPWPSKDMYLKAHYDLLREDAVSPLRDAVAYVREDPHMMDSQAACIYEKVSLVSCGHVLDYTYGLTCKPS